MEAMTASVLRADLRAGESRRREPFGPEPPTSHIKEGAGLQSLHAAQLSNTSLRPTLSRNKSRTARSLERRAKAWAFV